MDIQEIRRANLAALVQLRFHGNQSALAMAVDRQPSYISRCLAPTGKHSKPIGEKFARHIEAALELAPGALDTLCGHDTPERRSLYDGATPIFSASKFPMYPMEIWDDETPLGPDEVELPFFQEVELSAGKGSEVMLETGGRKLRFGRRTLQRKGVSPEAAACVPVTGNSMEPVLPDGSTAGIDTAATQVQDGKMYAIDHSGQLRVKLLYKLPGGGLRVRSYNAEEHPDERYEGDYVSEHIRIIGKVFWYSVLL